MDANFRLKCADAGSKGDKGLGTGWAYFVNPDVLRKELERVKKDPPRKEVWLCLSIVERVHWLNQYHR